MMMTRKLLMRGSMACQPKTQIAKGVRKGGRWRQRDVSVGWHTACCIDTGCCGKGGAVGGVGGGSLWSWRCWCFGHVLLYCGDTSCPLLLLLLLLLLQGLKERAVDVNIQKEV